MIDITIIGGGVVGCLIGRELSRYRVKTLLVEKGFHELVDFIETDRGAYARFILTGEAD